MFLFLFLLVKKLFLFKKTHIVTEIMTKSVSTIKCKRLRTSYVTFKSETSRHDFCAKNVAKYIAIMETWCLFKRERSTLLFWETFGLVKFETISKYSWFSIPRITNKRKIYHRGLLSPVSWNFIDKTLQKWLDNFNPLT